MSDELTLTIETPGAAAQTFAVAHSGEVSIGRGSECTVVLASPEVSRRHLTLAPTAAGVRVTDSSSNGTRVGEVLVVRSSREVPFGTPLHVGPYIVRVEGASAPGGPRTGAPSRASLPPLPPPLRTGAGLSVSGALPDLQARTRPPPRSSPPAPSGIAPSASSAAAPNPAAGPVAASAGALSFSGAPAALRKKAHRLMLDHLDLQTLDRARMDDAALRPRVREALGRILTQLGSEVPAGLDREALVRELADEALGLGPLEQLIADPSVSEVMVVDPQTIYVERGGRLERVAARFTDDEAVRAVIERIVTPLGRRIDESTPLVDARLRDGSRVNAVIRPIALRGSTITIRKFAKTPLTLDKLVGYGSLTDRIAKFLTRSVLARRNIVISGGTGSGKTTLLNVLSGAIPADERVVTIEDAAELQLAQPHVVALESRPPNMEGRGEFTIRDLLRNALRMRPDRIVVGECRGGEALDMLQAMNTGHDGSLTTTHANSPREAVSRLETLALMSGLDLPSRAIREQIAASVHLIVQQSRFSDGSRRVTSVAEVAGIGENGDVTLREIFAFHRTGTGPDGRVLGEFRATGYLPSFLDLFITQGLVDQGDFL